MSALCQWLLGTLSAIDDTGQWSGVQGKDHEMPLCETNLTAVHRLVTWIALWIECLMVRGDMICRERFENINGSNSGCGNDDEDFVPIDDDNAMDWIASRSRKAVAILARIQQDKNVLVKQLLEKVSSDPDGQVKQQPMLWFKEMEIAYLLRDDNALQKAKSSVEGLKGDLRPKTQMEKKIVSKKTFPIAFLAEMMFDF
jgi:hypothetical protein